MYLALVMEQVHQESAKKWVKERLNKPFHCHSHSIHFSMAIPKPEKSGFRYQIHPYLFNGHSSEIRSLCLKKYSCKMFQSFAILLE